MNEAVNKLISIYEEIIATGSVDFFFEKEQLADALFDEVKSDPTVAKLELVKVYSLHLQVLNFLQTKRNLMQLQNQLPRKTYENNFYDESYFVDKRF